MASSTPQQQTALNRGPILCGRELPLVYKKLTNLAKEFALLGHVEASADMVSLLLEEYTSEWQINSLNALAFGFDAAGVWPDGTPEEWRTKEGVAEIEKALAWKGFGDDGGENPGDDAVKTKEMLLALTTEPNHDVARSRCWELGLIDTTGALTMALSIAVEQLGAAGKSLEQIEKDDEVQRLLGQVAERMAAGARVGALVERRGLWPLFLSGALARKIGVDGGKLRAAGQDALYTFSERFGGGRLKCEIQAMSISQLVQRINDNTMANFVPGQPQESEFGPSIDISPKTLLVEPPTDIEDKILALEHSLGEPLPEDYKEFLRTTNGLGSSWSGRFLATPLFGVEDVTWVDMDYMEDTPIIFHGEPSGTSSVSWESGRWPAWKGTRVLAVSEHPNQPWSTLMLPPSEAKKVFEAYMEGPGPWEDWYEDEDREPDEQGDGGGEDKKEENGEYAQEEKKEEEEEVKDKADDYDDRYNHPYFVKDTDRRLIGNLLESRFGDWEGTWLYNDEWMVIRDELMVRGSMVGFGSFRMFLEGLAAESQDQLGGDGWISFKCRAD